MKSILFSVHTYNPDINGVQNVTHYIATGMVNKGYKVSVVTELRYNEKTYETIDGVNIYRIDVKTTMIGYSGNRDKYLELIKQINPDVFVPVCTQSWTSDWLPYNLDLLPGKKILYTHGFSGLTMNFYFNGSGIIKIVKTIISFLVFKIRWFLYYLQEHKKMQRYDKVIYLCRDDSAYMYARKHNLKNGVILENAVQNDFFIHKEIEHENNVPVIIYISNYINAKNQKMLLDAYSKMNVKAKLIFVGSYETSYYNDLCKYAKTIMQCNQGKQIDLLVGISRNDTIKMLQNADVFAITSRCEAYPLVAFEAMAAGKPVIATNVGNLSSIPGVLIAYDVVSMADLLDDYCIDKNLRKEVGKLLKYYSELHNQMQYKINQFESIIISLEE